MRFAGKVVAITGGAQGLGAHYAARFAAEGARIAVCDINSCDATVNSLQAGGAEALGAHCDVTSAADCEAFIDAVRTEFGRLDVLINNAALYGGLSFGPFSGIDEAEWDACMSINVKGIWQMCKAAVPLMKEGEGGGSIVNVASLAATFGMPYGVHYSASKGAVISMTRAMAREIAKTEIRVNAVAPSLIDTPGTKAFLNDMEERMTSAVVQGQSIKRQVGQDDVAGTVLYLASDEAKFITGQTIAVDGGTVML
ncbi:MAG: SDR family NAD(P)-dependent oxidoreductase [Sphingomonadales bacterium]